MSATNEHSFFRNFRLRKARGAGCFWLVFAVAMGAWIIDAQFFAVSHTSGGITKAMNSARQVFFGITLYAAGEG